jgi:hypothetical protein
VWKWILAHICYALGSTPGTGCDSQPSGPRPCDAWGPRQPRPRVPGGPRPNAAGGPHPPTTEGPCRPRPRAPGSRGSRAWAASARAARGHAARAPASDGRAHAALSWSDPRQGLRPTPPRAAPSWPWAAAARKKRLTVRVPTPTVCSYGLTCMGLLGHLGLARHIGHMFYHSNFYFL